MFKKVLILIAIAVISRGKKDIGCHLGVIQHGVSMPMQPQAQCVLLQHKDIRVGHINGNKLLIPLIESEDKTMESYQIGKDIEEEEGKGNKKGTVLIFTGEVYEKD